MSTSLVRPKSDYGAVSGTVLVISAPLGTNAHSPLQPNWKRWGNLTGHPLTIINPTNGIGYVISNNTGTGDVVLTQNINMVGDFGQFLHRAMSAPQRRDALNLSTNLSSKTGSGGNLTIIAGFDFTGTPSSTLLKAAYDRLQPFKHGRIGLSPEGEHIHRHNVHRGEPSESGTRSSCDHRCTRR